MTTSPPACCPGGEDLELALATPESFHRPTSCCSTSPRTTWTPASRKEVLDAIRRYEGAIVLVTHDEGAVEALEPDRVIVLPDRDRGSVE